MGFQVATFDCYGTLIDWEGGVAQFLYAHALRHGETSLPPGLELRAEWESAQFELLQQPYRNYKQVLAQSLRLVCDQHGWRYDAELAEDFVASMRSWQPFPDTLPALTRARDAGLRLVIFSNTDRDLVAHSQRHMRLEFDDIITAEDCGVYKPHPDFFAQALKRVDVSPEQIIHVAFGFKYDHAAAHAAGMSTAWVNRHVEAQAPGARPDYMWRDLWGLAALTDGKPIPQ